jgi:hypothetical protein
VEALADKPEMALLVSKIFAQWAMIEFQLSLLLMRVLGADAWPALAMHETLTAQHLQIRALHAAADATLSLDDLDMFKAAVGATESAQTPRNHLAHWLWGVCKEKPDVLILSEPKSMKRRASLVHQGIEMGVELTPQEKGMTVSEAPLIYSMDDLTRALRDLTEAHDAIQIVGAYLHYRKSPMAKGPRARERLAEAKATTDGLLSGLRLYQEALDRRRKGRQSTEPQPDAPPQQDGQK